MTRLVVAAIASAGWVWGCLRLGTTAMLRVGLVLALVALMLVILV